jgi:hypothetical protein
MPPTGDRFFVGDEERGDYHKKFDSRMAVKEFAGIALTLKPFLQHCQRQKEAGVPGFVDEPDFYDKETDKPLRKIIVEHDNASYNHGAECQVNSLSKLKCADILREELDLTSITYHHMCKDGTVVRNQVAQVPAKGEPWVKTGDYPSLEDVCQGLVNAIRDHPTKCHLIRPAYMYVCELYDIEITQTAPYTSPLCCIEFKWQDAKAWAANPRNQKEGRSCAEVVALCRRKWYDRVPDAEGKLQDPIHPSV